jgi:integrase/recombinase XerD
MTTDLAKYLSNFLSKYMMTERGMSRNTIAAYRDTFVLLLKFMQEEKRIKVEKLTLDKIQKETIDEFLNWLQKVRNCSNSTRNMRLAAIHSFYRYLQLECVDFIHDSQRILSIKFKRNQSPKTFKYFTKEGIQLLLQQPDRSSKKGRRDLALLSFMYATAARVQELIDLTPSSLRLEKPPIVQITGKGNKTRVVPLQSHEVPIIRNYIQENSLDHAFVSTHPLFQNYRKEKLTRSGVNQILQKYVLSARKDNNGLIPDVVSCHSIRHSRAMHLLQSGMNLIYIRDILGHSSVKTTEIYARTDSKQKREALEKSYISVNPSEVPEWNGNKNLIDWLKKF